MPTIDSMDRARMPHRPARRWRVLVVDDDPAILQLTRLNLELEGFEVFVAGDGSCALDMAKGDEPDAIVLDLMMPVMDGYRVLEELRADGRTRGIPVVVVSAVASMEDRGRLAAAGAAEVLSKPCDPADLSAAVIAALLGEALEAPRSRDEAPETRQLPGLPTL